MKKKSLALVPVLSLLISGCGQLPEDDGLMSPKSETSASAEISASEKPEVIPLSVTYLPRPSLITDNFKPEEITILPVVSYQKSDAGLANVDTEGFWLNDAEIELIQKNGFVLSKGYVDEFFQTYEQNRYSLKPNYVTVDSMMHTYHLYFSHLLKKIEKEHLYDEMSQVSEQMLQTAQMHYQSLQGTEWEEAAETELAFFAVGAALLKPETPVPDVVSAKVGEELARVSDAEGINYSSIIPDFMEDYTQYKPRGYYDESDQLKRYFKAMMWYGRIGFQQDDDMLNRAAVLITMGMQGEALEKWEQIYAVTSFFAGVSDDIGYCELRPLITAIYGDTSDVTALVGKDDLWTSFCQACAELPAPAINSIPVSDSVSDEEHDAKQKGFRFMGQRFSIDEACFTQLVYRQLDETSSGERRLLPDALDFPAALGSDTALSYAKAEGAEIYPDYENHINALRQTVREAPYSEWNSTLYSSWIYTLMPVLEEKDESYPEFMRTEEWRKKALVSFEGIYAELKHDTILYSKQIMGEMGGGDSEWKDDRGYVEAEPEVFSRLYTLVDAMSFGLTSYELIDQADQQNLQILKELSSQLKTIAVKELSGELPTEQEFDLIRTYGGQLEHFWEEVMDAEYPDESFHRPMNHPCPIVADIATDPNGSCLEVATGKPLEITVIVEVDGKLKLASGSVYSFYQFTQPISERLTDAEWRELLNQYDNPNDPRTQIPWWYSDIVYEYTPY